MKNTIPLISVYITNYNYAKYIKESIESLLNQTFQDFEVFIIDDGSTDNSKELIEKYRSNEKVTIIYQQNKGLNVTNNIAMRAAAGKYIMRLDADDFLESNALEIMSNTLEENPDFGLVFPDYFYVDAQGTKTGEEIRHNFNNEVSLYDQPAHGACTMIRLEFLKNLGGYNESFTCQDGYDLWIKFITHHQVTNISKPLFSYRRHGSNLTTNEKRILDTRKRIKDLHIETYGLTLPETVAIIPVRNTFIGGYNWPLYDVEGKSILELAINKLAASSKVSHIVVATSDASIIDHIISLSNLPANFSIVERPSEFAGINETLFKTFEHVLASFASNEIHPQAIMSVSLEYPFLTKDVIDDAINTLSIFKADSLLSVRPDNRMYYQHIGHGMAPLLDQEKFTKLEREALYKGLGGIVISTVKNFKEQNKMIAGKVGHIVVDQKAGFGVFTEFDLQTFQALALSSF